MRRATLLAALLALAACDFDYADIEVTGAYHREAIAFLSGVQPASIAANREYCGYMGIDGNGRFTATGPNRGDTFTCELPRNAPGVSIVASYHTHAAFDPSADGEVPSANDVILDIEHGTYGYVATPGGRVWFVDWKAEETRLLCGPGCIASDPAYDGRLVGPVAPVYTLPQLIRRDAGGG
ncbi:DUF4329 domain-containing protein [Ovoidimarina sediminis]|uniref:DUF4329 domain-containing protein n=1 Tax=Ovoidimarina sediminis TaxID=3079856 RepID=UPI0029135DC5|nr:DUF4329 domain-containing protein [Rhodophyticola sp. MJ-SS7]MDU8944441.1 DUF4329 domain-containing protein [Rhodophyticola sp. MJ-SS7]